MITVKVERCEGKTSHSDYFQAACGRTRHHEPHRFSRLRRWFNRRRDQ